MMKGKYQFVCPHCRHEVVVELVKEQMETLFRRMSLSLNCPKCKDEMLLKLIEGKIESVRVDKFAKKVDPLPQHNLVAESVPDQLALSPLIEQDITSWEAANPKTKPAKVDLQPIHEDKLNEPLLLDLQESIRNIYGDKLVDNRTEIPTLTMMSEDETVKFSLSNPVSILEFCTNWFTLMPKYGQVILILVMLVILVFIL